MTILPRRSGELKTEQGRPIGALGSIGLIWRLVAAGLASILDFISLLFIRLMLLQHTPLSRIFAIAIQRWQKKKITESTGGAIERDYVVLMNY